MGKLSVVFVILHECRLTFSIEFTNTLAGDVKDSLPTEEWQEFKKFLTGCFKAFLNKQSF